MLISSPFRTRCYACKAIVEKGERIQFKRAHHRIYHAMCTEEGRDMHASMADSHALTSTKVFHAPDGLSYLPFQRAGIAFILARKGTLEADEMGLGKTVQTVGALNNSEWRNACIICPKSLVTNWLLEIKKWRLRPWSIQIVDGITPVYDYAITICSYEQLKHIRNSTYDWMILDEAHAIKNPDAKRTGHIRRIAFSAKRKLALTGTPIPSRPIELWPILQIIAPEIWDANGKGYKRFILRYCDAKTIIIGRAFVEGAWRYKKACDVKGASNLPELQERLRGSVMIRRLKSEVLQELPPKRRRIILLPAETTEDGECIDIVNLPDDLDECVKRMTVSQVKFEEFSRLRKEQALRKVPAAIEHIKNVLGSIEGKVIVFAHHIEVLDGLAAGLVGYRPIRYQGDTSLDERAQAVHDFQHDANRRLFLGGLTAAGVGLTLTAATYEIFVESSYVPGVQTQAEDRAHRIGQRESLTIDAIAQDGTLDAHMMRLVLEKQEILDLALDRSTL